MQTLNYLLSLLFAIAIPSSSFGQHAVPIFYSPPYKSHDGFAVFINSDTLYGKIQLHQNQKKDWGIMLETNSRKRFIPNDSLTFVRLYDYDSTLISTKYTEYKRLTDKPQLWRHLASGKVEIYDDVLYCNEAKDKIGDHLLVVDSGRVENISHRFSIFLTDDLLKFTNEKHHTKYKARDFKTNKDLLQYVASKG